MVMATRHAPSRFCPLPSISGHFLRGGATLSSDHWQTARIIPGCLPSPSCAAPPLPRTGSSPSRSTTLLPRARRRRSGQKRTYKKLRASCSVCTVALAATKSLPMTKPAAKQKVRARPLPIAATHFAWRVRSSKQCLAAFPAGRAPLRKPLRNGLRRTSTAAARRTWMNMWLRPNRSYFSAVIGLVKWSIKCWPC